MKASDRARSNSHWSHRFDYLALRVVLIAVGAGSIGSLAALDGGVFGLFMVMASTVLAGVAGLLWIAASVRDVRPRLRLSMPTVALGCGTLILTAFASNRLGLGRALVEMKLFPTGGTSYSLAAKRIECIFGNRICTILDPHGQIKFQDGGTPAELVIESETLVVRFVDTPLALKTSREQIYLEASDITVGGWMGAKCPMETGTFSVDRSGNFKWIGQPTKVSQVE